MAGWLAAHWSDTALTPPASGHPSRLHPARSMCDLSAAQGCYPPSATAASGGVPGGDAGTAPGHAGGNPGGTNVGGEEWPPSDVLEWFAEMQQSVTMYHAWKNWLPDFSFQHCPSKLCRWFQSGLIFSPAGLS